MIYNTVKSLLRNLYYFVQLRTLCGKRKRQWLNDMVIYKNDWIVKCVAQSNSLLYVLVGQDQDSISNALYGGTGQFLVYRVNTEHIRLVETRGVKLHGIDIPDPVVQFIEFSRYAPSMRITNRESVTYGKYVKLKYILGAIANNPNVLFDPLAYNNGSICIPWYKMEMSNA